VWEGGVRIPFLMRWPGRLPAGAIYRKPVISLDLMATSVAAAGGTVDPAWNLDGVNLLPYLGGPGAGSDTAPGSKTVAEMGAAQSGSPHESLYWRMGEKRAIRHGDWKLVQELGEEKPALYNLAEDVAEETDRSGDRAEVAGDLESMWRKWNAELEAPRWTRLPGDKKKKANAPNRAARRAANPAGEKNQPKEPR
jgi:arylsulfatase A-like enzyme